MRIEVEDEGTIWDDEPDPMWETEALDDLREVAFDLDIEGYEEMSREELLEAIRKAG
jgi:hypothetical protein